MEYKPILISELVKQYKEDIEKKRGFFEKRRTSGTRNYNNIELYLNIAEFIGMRYN